VKQLAAEKEIGPVWASERKAIAAWQIMVALSSHPDKDLS
jgi:hypothetical protein